MSIFVSILSFFCLLAGVAEENESKARWLLFGFVVSLTLAVILMMKG